MIPANPRVKVKFLNNMIGKKRILFSNKRCLKGVGTFYHKLSNSRKVRNKKAVMSLKQNQKSYIPGVNRQAKFVGITMKITFYSKGGLRARSAESIQ